MTVTGRPWDELEDTLTWPRITALCDYWQSHPPVHELVASAMGVKPKEKQSEKASLEEFMAMFDNGVLK